MLNAFVTWMDAHSWAASILGSVGGAFLGALFGWLFGKHSGKKSGQAVVAKAMLNTVQQKAEKISNVNGTSDSGPGVSIHDINL